MPSALTHPVLYTPIDAPWPSDLAVAVFGMGCFWGAERLFWQQDVYTTAVGYAGGHEVPTSYRRVCAGDTGHAEVVRVVYDPADVSYERLLAVFFSEHDPTQGDRQGNDVGSQYRSVVYTTTDEQLALARAAAARYQKALDAAGRGRITTEIGPLASFCLAEDEHQQYLYHQPGGYCGLAGTGVSCPAPETSVSP